MAHRNAQLLVLQSNCKRDPESYRSEFELQWSHFLALKDLFSLKPNHKSPEFGDMVHFLAHVSQCYTEIAQPFSECLVELLDMHATILHPQLRMQLLQALMHMRHKKILNAEPILALCFRLSSCHDKMLRATLHSYIIQDIKLANSKSRNDRLNKSIQNYLYRVIEGDGEAAVKRALAVCTDLWRRQIWRDARTVNVIASATAHESPNVMLAALKFFLGQDVVAEEAAEDDTNADDSTFDCPSKDDVYRAYHKGTATTKKKKIRKLKRVMRVVEKSKRRGQASSAHSFAAMQLLHDPQTFSERLLVRCQARGVSFEARLALMQVVSRTIGVHELILENFYPFVQRYLKPSQREVVAILAAAVQACHKLVPPDVLRPLLLQVVDQFVHDKARPEVMTVGLKTVRELCVRCPRIMDDDLLSDLVLYKKEKDKHVKNAAKALVSLFRELKPSMLVKKERGRGADLSKDLEEYGALDIKSRVDGVNLLEDAIKQGKTGSDLDDSDDEEGSGAEDHLSHLEGQHNIDSDDSDVQAESDSEHVTEGDSDALHFSNISAGHPEAVPEDDQEGSDEDVESEADLSENEEDDDNSGGDVLSDSGDQSDDAAADVEHDEHQGERRGRQRKKAKVACPTKAKQAPSTDSLKQLKQKIAQAEAKKSRVNCAIERTTSTNPRADDETEDIPLEQMRVLTQEDFERIRKLKIKKMVDDALTQQGLKSANRRAKAKEDLYEQMEEALDEQEAREGAPDRRLNPHSLLGKRSGRADKAERMASVMSGREGREAFGSSVSRKKLKSGGKSNIEKQKRKVLPLGAMKQQAANRKLRQKQRNNPKHQRGRASRGAWD